MGEKRALPALPKQTETASRVWHAVFSAVERRPRISLAFLGALVFPCAAKHRSSWPTAMHGVGHVKCAPNAKYSMASFDTLLRVSFSLCCPPRSRPLPHTPLDTHVTPCPAPDGRVRVELQTLRQDQRQAVVLQPLHVDLRAGGPLRLVRAQVPGAGEAQEAPVAGI